MFGIRVLIFILGIALVIWILIRLYKGPAVEQKKTKKVDEMVRCAQCGVFVPRNEALKHGEQFYCCSQHRDQNQ